MSFLFPSKKISISLVSFGVLCCFLLFFDCFLIDYGVFCDWFSTIMIVLLLWLVLTIYFLLEKSNVKMLLLNCMSIVCCLFFLSKSVLSLFVLFELSIFPILVLILGWGSQPERIQAGFFMFLYTLLCSSPLLLMTAYSLGSGEGGMVWSTSFFESPFWLFSNNFFCLFFLLGFVSKIPIFIAHTWLPKAHVEATLEGSMILAGILLKLGVFGVIRTFSVFLFLGNTTFVLFMSIAALGMLMAALTASSSDDAKMIVAYASVSHMNLLIYSIFTQKLLAKKGSGITCFSHGLASSLLFFSVYFIYNISHSRSMVLNKGILGVFPILVLISFFSWALNLSIPPSMGFWGELFSLMVMFTFTPEIGVVLIFYFLLSSFYSMFSFGVLTHSENPFSLKMFTGFVKDYFCSWFLVSPMIFFYLCFL